MFQEQTELQYIVHETTEEETPPVTTERLRSTRKETKATGLERFRTKRDYWI